MSLCIVTQNHVFLIPYNQENTKKLNTSKILKRVRVEIRYLCLHMLILVAMACPDPPEIYPCIGVVIYGNNLSSPPWKKVSWIGVGHPTTPHFAHRICPTSLVRISNPVERNIHSRAQSWNTLKEKHAQNTVEPEVPHSL